MDKNFEDKKRGPTDSNKSRKILQDRANMAREGLK
jgi:hypothetical protein